MFFNSKPISASAQIALDYLNSLSDLEQEKILVSVVRGHHEQQIKLESHRQFVAAITESVTVTKK